MRSFTSGILAALLAASVIQAAPTAKLHVGTATADITPPLPVAVSGQFALRVATRNETPLTANVLALESRDDDQSHDMAIMVSCDLLYIPDSLRDELRQKVSAQVPGIETAKIVLSGTHTHTAPVLISGKYPIPKEITQVRRYREYFTDRVSAAIAEAWARRAAARVTWGLSHAVVGFNRRAAYADGSARMYGRVDTADFRGLESYEDHDVDTLFFSGPQGTLIAVAINVACPAQELESRSTVNADFWHPVREQLRKQYGDQLCVLGWVGPSGDQSPHLMYRKSADERMRRLRGLTRVEEIARRIVRAVDEAYGAVKRDQHEQVVLSHHVESLRLPMRHVSEAEFAEARSECARIDALMDQDSAAAARLLRRRRWYEETVRRFTQQQDDPNPMMEMELHVIRLGDVVICTNPFELFTEFGIRMKARSRAEQTILVQLAGPGTYVPTEQAVGGGHYSAVVHSSHVGPKGGQVLVDRTVEVIHSLFPPAK